MAELQLKNYAREYLESGDAESGNNLLNAGTKAMPAIVEALVMGLRRVSDQSWVKPSFEEETRKHFGDNPEIMKYVANMLETSNFDGPGMSLAIRDYADQAVKRAWQVTNKIGSAGIQTLIQLITDRDRTIGCAAALIFSGAEQLSYSSVQSFQKITPFWAKLDSKQPSNNILLWIIVAILAKSGVESAEEMIDTHRRRINFSREEFYNSCIERAILFVGQGATG